MDHPVSIMLVEDEAIIAMDLRFSLQQAGYQVGSIAATGEEAIEIARRESPDIMLIDIRLAGDLDGIETAQKIRATSDIPLIFMTGYEDEKLHRRANQLNPLAYLIKPVKLHELTTAIDTSFG